MASLSSGRARRGSAKTFTPGAGFERLSYFEGRRRASVQGRPLRGARFAPAAPLPAPHARSWARMAADSSPIPPTTGRPWQRTRSDCCQKAWALTR